MTSHKTEVKQIPNPKQDCTIVFNFIHSWPQCQEFNHHQLNYQGSIYIQTCSLETSYSNIMWVTAVSGTSWATVKQSWLIASTGEIVEPDWSTSCSKACCNSWVSKKTHACCQFFYRTIFCGHKIIAISKISTSGHVYGVQYSGTYILLHYIMMPPLL